MGRGDPGHRDRRSGAVRTAGCDGRARGHGRSAARRAAGHPAAGPEREPGAGPDRADRRRARRDRRLARVGADRPRRGCRAPGVAGLLALLGRRDLWLKIGMLITGSTMAIIAIVNVLRAGSKAADIKERFGIPPGEVHASIGAGLWVVVVGAVLVAGAGLRLR